MKKGIDVSYAQGDIDWGKIKKEGVINFAIIRAGYGKLTSQKDNKFEANYKGCKDNGIPCGVYWYSYAKTESEAEQEAKAFLEVVKGKQFKLPVYYNVEEKSQLALGKEKVSAIIRKFLNTVEKAGYWVGLYSSASVLNTYIADDIKSRYAIWVANWDVSKPSYTGQYGVWQYGIKKNYGGYIGEIDVDYLYVDYETTIKEKGLNGYTTKSSTSNTEKVTVEIIIGGKKYSGELKKEG